MKIFTIIIGILAIICGFILMLTPGITFLSVGWMLAVLLLMMGINSCAAYFAGRKTKESSGWDLFGGVLTVILSLILFGNAFARFLTDVFAIYMFGVWLLISGAMRIGASLQIKKAAGKSWIWIMIFGILTILIGIYSFFHPLVTAIAIGFMIGLTITSQGINLAIMGASIKKDKGPDAPA